VSAPRLTALAALLALAVAGCGSTGVISPNDPEYGRSGAPRVGEPPLQAGSYGRIMGNDGQGTP
jgi:hypothetical protein